LDQHLAQPQGARRFAVAQPQGVLYAAAGQQFPALQDNRNNNLAKLHCCPTAAVPVIDGSSQVQDAATNLQRQRKLLSKSK
jgi:hypothetical protein